MGSPSSSLCVYFLVFSSHSEGHGKILVILTASIRKVVERIRWKSQVVLSNKFFQINLK